MDKFACALLSQSIDVRQALVQTEHLSTRGREFAVPIKKICMRWSRKVCQRGSNVFFLVDKGRENPDTTI